MYDFVLQGCAQVSLADFDPRNVSVRWYNILSFKFMQADIHPALKTAGMPSTKMPLSKLAPVTNTSSSRPSGPSSSSSSEGLRSSHLQQIKQVHIQTTQYFGGDNVLSQTVICIDNFVFWLQLYTKSNRYIYRQLSVLVKVVYQVKQVQAQTTQNFACGCVLSQTDTCIDSILVMSVY